MPCSVLSHCTCCMWVRSETVASCAIQWSMGLPYFSSIDGKYDFGPVTFSGIGSCYPHPDRPCRSVRVSERAAEHSSPMGTVLRHGPRVTPPPGSLPGSARLVQVVAGETRLRLGERREVHEVG